MDPHLDDFRPINCLRYPRPHIFNGGKQTRCFKETRTHAYPVIQNYKSRLQQVTGVPVGPNGGGGRRALRSLHASTYSWNVPSVGHMYVWVIVPLSVVFLWAVEIKCIVVVGHVSIHCDHGWVGAWGINRYATTNTWIDNSINESINQVPINESIIRYFNRTCADVGIMCHHLMLYRF